jgi:hypothetical protein
MKKGSKYWKKKAWGRFSQYIRLRDYANQVDPEPYEAPCISCGRKYPIAGVGCLQAGHFITRTRGAILFDERNVHAQCYNCNHTLKGNWDKYYDAMKQRYGQETIDELLEKRFDDSGFNPVVLEQYYDDFTTKLSELTAVYGNPFKR